MDIMKIQRTSEFKEWFDAQTEKSKAQIDARLAEYRIIRLFWRSQTAWRKIVGVTMEKWSQSILYIDKRRGDNCNSFRRF